MDKIRNNTLNANTLEYLVSTYSNPSNLFIFQVGEICRNTVNDLISVQFSDNMDIIGRISRDIENEGINLSNEKLLKICQALKQLTKTYYKIYVRDSTAPLAEGEQAIDHFADINGRLTA